MSTFRGPGPDDTWFVHTIRGLTVHECSSELFCAVVGPFPIPSLSKPSPNVGRRVVAPPPAVTGVDALLVVDLMVHLDIELVIRRMSRGEVIVIEFGCCSAGDRD